MTYTIHRFTAEGIGPMLSSGQTRAQVEAEIVRLGLDTSLAMRLPRFGRVAVLSRPLCDQRGSYAVVHQ